MSSLVGVTDGDGERGASLQTMVLSVLIFRAHSPSPDAHHKDSLSELCRGRASLCNSFDSVRSQSAVILKWVWRRRPNLIVLISEHVDVSFSLGRRGEREGN